jgi:mannose-1-phosphate guanylyltransferase
MQAIILAGGFGTRLRPLTYEIPKPLLPLAGRPLIDWALHGLPAEVDELVVAGQWLLPEIEAHLRRTCERRVRFVKEDAPLGSGGAVAHAAGEMDEPFLVLNADIVSDINVAGMIRQHRQREPMATVAAAEVPTAEIPNFGIFTPDPADPRSAKAFVEKPAIEDAPSRLANAGIYLLSPEVLDLVPPQRLVSLEKEIFPQLLPEGLDIWHHAGRWIDVGNRQRMIEAHHLLGGDSPAGAIRSIVMDGARIGEGALVRDSIIGPGARIAPGSRIISCIVGQRQSVSGSFRDCTIWEGSAPEGYPDGQVGNAIQHATTTRT